MCVCVCVFVVVVFFWGVPMSYAYRPSSSVDKPEAGGDIVEFTVEWSDISLPTKSKYRDSTLSPPPFSPLFFSLYPSSFFSLFFFFFFSFVLLIVRDFLSEGSDL